jgi:hypothetical protein
VSFVCPMNVRLGEVRERARSPHINKSVVAVSITFFKSALVVNRDYIRSLTTIGLCRKLDVA